MNDKFLIKIWYLLYKEEIVHRVPGNITNNII